VYRTVLNCRLSEAKFAIKNSGNKMSKNVMKLINNTYYSQKDCQVDFDLFICRKNELPSTPGLKRFGGKYKGIPWQVVIQDSEAYQKKRFFFYSTLFAAILAKRIVFLPYLKYKTIANGNLLLPCTSFEFQGRIFLLLGFSGTGKSKMMLEALEKGAKFIGDERVILYSYGGLVDCSEIIAMGYATVRETKFWQKLSIANKLLLWTYQFVFLMSGKYFKFNLYLKPEQLDIEKITGFETKRVVFIQLAKTDKKRRLSPIEAAAAILEKEDRFRLIYGDIFSLSEKRKTTEKIIASLFSDISSWRIPIGKTLDDISSIE
jgi:hypothetical protein